MNKIKRYFALTKIALYKFLGKFIPYFKNKTMYHMKKEEILESVKLKLEDILNRYDNKLRLSQSYQISIGEKEKDENGYSLLSRFSASYKIIQFDFNMVLSYIDSKKIEFTLDNVPLLSNNEHITTLKNIFGSEEINKELNEYFKNIRTTI
ncbi:hypothetical protein HX004_16755 [Myroides sp. 1354]|uniref:hypothetical protein n=1 Tax=unclassified Myroides TaxID=2642485 RepID=UPI0025755B3E|nr:MULTISPECIES: hypothetical protein [unclassified Myroides]MDM1046468.1 hypothetical protein [Myroides sp. R163-1]MDM1057409.1 hypothetical protein [Myroides sp. 1354]MDM1070694.1 hypothetical protein [Myroides sp. 1372]